MTDFEQKLWEAQPALLAYACVLSGAPQEAGDLVGEANLALMRRRDEYDPARPFLPWARAFVYYAVQTWRAHRMRSRLVVDDALATTLADEIRVDGAAGGDGGLMERRQAALKAACRELTPEMRYLLARYYTYGDSLEVLGAQLNRTAHSLAVSLHYIRRVLRKSVEQKLKEADDEN